MTDQQSLARSSLSEVRSLLTETKSDADRLSVRSAPPSPGTSPTSRQSRCTASATASSTRCLRESPNRRTVGRWQHGEGPDTYCHAPTRERIYPAYSSDLVMFPA